VTWIASHYKTVFRVLLGTLLVVCVTLYLTGVLSALNAAIVLAAGVVLLLISFRKTSDRLFQSIDSVSVSTPFGGFGLTAKKAATQAPESEAEPGTPPELPADSLLSLRFKLESKLAYIGKHLLNEETVDDPRPAVFLTVGSLRHDGYISDEQAEVATQILTMQPRDYALIPDDRRARWLDNANDLATNIRASVFSGMVRKQLKADGWHAAQLARKGAKGTDFLAAEKGVGEGPYFRVAPTYAMSATSDILQAARERLRKRRDREPASSQIIVVPNRSRYEDREPVDGPRVVRLMNLAAALAGAQALAAR
jgi:hypothetical protein